MKISPAQCARILVRITHTATKEQLKNILKTFVVFLAQERMVPSLPRILQLYAQYYKREHNIADVIITTARPLDAGTLQHITTSLGTLRAEYTTHVDEACIGGITLQVNDDRMDATMYARLEKMCSLVSS